MVHFAHICAYGVETVNWTAQCGARFVRPIINFFRRVFSECTEAIVASLIPLDIILPEICAFIFGASYWMNKRMKLISKTFRLAVFLSIYQACRNLLSQLPSAPCSYYSIDIQYYQWSFIPGNCWQKQCQNKTPAHYLWLVKQGDV